MSTTYSPTLDSSTIHSASDPLPINRIWQTWWPLAIAWLITTAEIPMMAAIIARLAAPELNLAAWSIAFPVTIILSAPLMSMLSASAALSKDWASYATVRRYQFILGSAMITIQFLFAFTPPYLTLAVTTSHLR